MGKLFLKSKAIVVAYPRSKQIGATSEKGICGLNVIIGLHKRKGGFTLIELLIVIAILGTIVGIAVPMSAAYLNQSKVAKAKIEIRSIEREIIIYYSDHDRYPDGLAEIGLNGLMDPYGNPYQYMPIENNDEKGLEGKTRKDHNLVPVNTDFDLYSMGRDGKSRAPFTAKASRDDIVRANNGQFLGLVSEY